MSGTSSGGHDEVVGQLQSVTGADREFCRSLLQANGWNFSECLDLLLTSSPSSAMLRSPSVPEQVPIRPATVETPDIQFVRSVRQPAAQRLVSSPPLLESTLMDVDSDRELQVALAASLHSRVAPTGPNSDDDLHQALRFSKQTAGATPASHARGVASERTRAPPPAEYHLNIVYHERELSVMVPQTALLRDLKAAMSLRRGVKPADLNFLGWPLDPTFEPSDEIPLRRLLGEPTGRDPIKLIAIAEDSASGGTPPSRTRASPTAGKRLYSTDNHASDDEDDYFMDILDDALSHTPEPYGTAGVVGARNTLVPADSHSVADFAQAFCQRYGEEGPEFFQDSLRQAYNFACDRGVPLLVYLHNGDVVETNIFCSQVLTHGLISLTINENFVPWGWDVTKDSNRLAFIRECQNLSPQLYSLLPTRYPALAAILRVQGVPRVVSSIAGYHSVDQLLDKIMSDLLVKCNPILEAERAKELEAMQRQQLKLEQDQALQASLATDRAKEQRRREEDERTRIEQQERNQIERDQQRQAELDTRMRQQRVSEEPPSNYAGPMATIQFRLPTGARLSRRFYLSDRVQDVVDFVALQDFKPPTYILATVRPRHVLNENPAGTTLEEIGIHKRDVIVVEETFSTS